MWKVLHAILPTCINLVGRFVDVDPMCKRCGVDIESTEHALRDCAWVRQFWENKALVQGSAMGGSLEEWVVASLSALPEEEQCLFATMLWFLWYLQNQLYFN